MIFDNELEDIVRDAEIRGYNTAIDDFVLLLKLDIHHSIFDSRDSLAEHIEEISEHLKTYNQNKEFEDMSAWYAEREEVEF